MKTAVITGGNSGIGKATAIQLAKNGYRIIFNGRNQAKTLEAVDEICKASGSKDVKGITQDISTLKGMKAFADEVKRETQEIHALILSSGVIMPNHVLTEDNMEMGFAVQYLSRFVVTQLLQKELENGSAHIVHVGAPIMKGAQIHFDNLNMKEGFTMMKAMAQEMFANHLMVQEFAKRNPSGKVKINIMHVGIAKTDIARETNKILQFLLNIVGTSAEKASKNVLYLASDECKFSGYFLPKPKRNDYKELIHYDENVAAKLWETSLKIMEPIKS